MFQTIGTINTAAAVDVSTVIANVVTVTSTGII